MAESGPTTTASAGPGCSSGTHCSTRCGSGPNAGDASWGRAVYEEIVEPERIVYTDSFSDRHGNVNKGMPETRSTVELSDLGERTEVVIRARYPSAEDLQQVLDMGMVEGLTETLDRLAEYLGVLFRGDLV